MKSKKFKEEFEIKFWKDWLEADMLKRGEMVEKLPLIRFLDDGQKLSKKMRLRIFAQLLNSYFEDLESAVYTKIRLEKKVK